LLVCVPQVTGWWVWYEQSNHGVGAELNTHRDTNIVQTLDAMITANVLGLEYMYSTFSGSTAMLTQDRAVYTKDRWPREQHSDAVQVPHPWYADWLTCAEEIQTTVRARPERLIGLSVSHSKSILYGGFVHVWACRALNHKKWRFSVWAGGEIMLNATHCGQSLSKRVPIPTIVAPPPWPADKSMCHLSRALVLYTRCIMSVSPSLSTGS
jgi:hypothetical protein